LVNVLGWLTNGSVACLLRGLLHRLEVMFSAGGSCADETAVKLDIIQQCCLGAKDLTQCPVWQSGGGK